MHLSRANFTTSEAAKTIAPSASMEITQLARDMKASGKDIISLSIGDPHFPITEAIRMSLNQAICDNKSHYLDSKGIFELRDKIANNYRNNQIKPENVLVVPGVKQGLFYLLSVLDGQMVLVLEPAWLGYKNTVHITGKTFKSINTHEEDWIEKLKRSDFDILIFCSPNNPDGRIFSSIECMEIVEIVRQNNAFLIADEVYSKFSYSKEHFSVSRVDDLGKIFILNGFSKSHAMTGFRIGYIASVEQQILKLCNLMQQHIATCVHSLSQFAALGFDEAENEISKMRDYYLSNKEIIKKMIPNAEKYEPAGGFYYFMNLKYFGITNGTKFCSSFLKDKGVSLVPGAAYGNEFSSFVRISFCIEKELLHEGVKRLSDYLQI